MAPLPFVSNPLRLEGDGLDDAQRADKILFLIHYGWRGTISHRKQASP